MRFMKINLPSVSDTSNSSQDRDLKPALILGKKYIDGRHKANYIQIYDPETQKVNEIALKKASFFKSFGFRLSSAYSNTKIIKIDVFNAQLNKTQKYYARVNDICKACGLQTENSLEDHEIQEALSKKADEGLENLLSRIQTLGAQSLKERVKRKRLTGDIQGVINLIQREENLFNQSVKVTRIAPLSLIDDDLVKQCRLSESELRRINHLANYVPIDNLANLLKKASSEREVDKLVNTFCMASRKLKNGVPEKNIYEKKTKDSFSFSITTSGNLIIAFDKLAAGSFKKVNNAINVNNLEALVKVVIRGESNVKNYKKENRLQKTLYNSNNPYVMKPNHVSILTSRGNKLRFGRENKYVFFEKKMDGDGTKISSNNPLEIAQFCHDLSKGLSFMHKQGFVHCDVKPENALRKGKRALVSDFGVTSEIDTQFNGCTLPYTPPENLKIKRSPHTVIDMADNVAHPSFDSYSLGITILGMIDQKFKMNHIDSSNHNYLSLLSESQKNQLFLEIRNRINNDPIKLKLIELAQQLTDASPKKRPSCEEASRILGKIQGIVTSDPI